MEINPRQEMKDFLNSYTSVQKIEVSFLGLQASKLSSLLKKYKNVNIPRIHHVLQPQLDDLIDEIDEATSDKRKQNLTNARHKYQAIEREFFSLFESTNP